MNGETYGDAYVNGYHLTKRFLLSRGVPFDSAEEAAQAAWARGWACRDSLRNPRQIVRWINSIALNLFRTEIRKERRCGELHDMLAARDSGRDLAAVDLSRALLYCKRPEGELLWQYYVAGYSSGELAELWGCSPVAIRVRLLRARRKLAKTLTAGTGAASARASN